MILAKKINNFFHVTVQQKTIKGLDYFHKYNDLKKAAEEEYINLYGPIVSSQVKSRDRWTWVNEPWPWEGGAD